MGALPFILDQVPQRLHSRVSRARGNIGTGPVFPLNRAQGLPSGFSLTAGNYPNTKAGKRDLSLYSHLPLRKNALKGVNENPGMRQ